MEISTITHLKVATIILLYVKSTMYFDLWFSLNNDYKLIDYYNSDWVRDKDDQKSTKIFMFFMGNTTFTWMAKKRPIVSFSICEEEYLTTTSCVSYIVWLRNIFEGIRNVTREADQDFCG